MESWGAEPTAVLVNEAVKTRDGSIRGVFKAVKGGQRVWEGLRGEEN